MVEYSENGWSLVDRLGTTTQYRVASEKGWYVRLSCVVCVDVVNQVTDLLVHSLCQRLIFFRGLRLRLYGSWVRSSEGMLRLLLSTLFLRSISLTSSLDSISGGLFPTGISSTRVDSLVLTMNPPHS